MSYFVSMLLNQSLNKCQIQLQYMRIIINLMKKLNVIIVLALMIICVCCGMNCPCKNDGACTEDMNYCVCKQGFLGKFCEYPAINILSGKYSGNLTQNVTLFYYSPDETNYYQIRISVCNGDNKKISGVMNVYLQLLSNYFSPQIDHINKNIILQPNSCQLVQEFFLPFRTKINGEMQKLIIGLKSVNNQKPDSLQPFSIQCSGTAFLSRSFWMILVITFLAIVSLMLIGSIIMVIRQRLLNRRRVIAQKQSNNLQHFDKVMPSSKYSEFTEQQKLECSICLCELELNDSVRKTPCEHIFHTNCLDEWCVKNITCPVCRKNFQKHILQVEIELKQNTNMRKGLLQIN